MGRLWARRMGLQRERERERESRIHHRSRLVALTRGVCPLCPTGHRAAVLRCPISRRWTCPPPRCSSSTACCGWVKEERRKGAVGETRSEVVGLLAGTLPRSALAMLCKHAMGQSVIRCLF
mmetsp:Transcript_50446/g.143058  ORF Transcript_50446/g.143058 Transcript_50446/m.143058 type:complete len:121 (-) Transcript_50446:29-391(-)